MKGLHRLPKGAVRRACGWTLALLVLAAGTSNPAQQLLGMPDSIELTRGQSLRWTFDAPLESSVDADDAQVLQSLDERLDGVAQVKLTGRETGDAQVTLRLLGVPVKTVSVRVNEARRVMPGGQSIGVALRMTGVLVVGASDIGAQNSPARVAGLRSGDVIRAVDGEAVDGAAALSALLSSGGERALSIERSGKPMTVRVSPVRDGRDGAYRLGAWVRDSTAGVGTLSFSDPGNGTFAALGHAITDADTGTVLDVAEGGIYESQVVDVTPGAQGQPGELLGEFFDKARQLGDVLSNTAFGLYGRSTAALLNPLYPDGVPVRTRDEVHLGGAVLLTTICGEEVKPYACEVTRVYRQDQPAQRGLSIRITDPRLLQATGGIVQGMSGSPILQDNCLIGAVTHVFINDPTQGYGMYADWMLAEMDGQAA